MVKGGREHSFPTGLFFYSHLSLPTQTFGRRKTRTTPKAELSRNRAFLVAPIPLYLLSPLTLTQTLRRRWPRKTDRRSRTTSLTSCFRWTELFSSRPLFSHQPLNLNTLQDVQLVRLYYENPIGGRHQLNSLPLSAVRFYIYLSLCCQRVTICLMNVQ